MSKYRPSFDLVWDTWKEMEGYINPNDDGALAVFGVNARYNPSILSSYSKAKQAPKEMQRAILEYEAKIIIRNYWERSLKSPKPTLHFFYKNAWSCPASRAMSLDLLEFAIKDFDLCSRSFENHKIQAKAIRRRLEIYDARIGFKEI